MSSFKNKIDFVAIVSVSKANSNGDPLNGNRPRTDYEGYGEITDVCIKRKIRNRMQDMGNKIFVQMSERADNDMKTLKDRANAKLKSIKEEEHFKTACTEWLDVRSFGQVFAFAGNGGKDKSVSCGVRGPVSIHLATSINPIDVRTFQITKSVSGSGDGKGKSSDTIGSKHIVDFGLYKIKGSINVQLAEKTGFSEEDANILKECLRTLFVNDASSARPDGSMVVVKLYWFKHNCKDGQYSAALVHNSVKINLKDGIDMPKSVDDYIIELDKTNIEALDVEEIDGI